MTRSILKRESTNLQANEVMVNWFSRKWECRGTTIVKSPCVNNCRTVIGVFFCIYSLLTLTCGDAEPPSQLSVFDPFAQYLLTYYLPLGPEAVISFGIWIRVYKSGLLLLSFPRYLWVCDPSHRRWTVGPEWKSYSSAIKGINSTRFK